MTSIETGARMAIPAPPPTPAPPPQAPAQPVPAAPHTGGLPAQSGGPEREQFMDAASHLRKAIGVVSSTDLQFSVDPDTHQVQINVIDRGTGDVVRSIPNEALVRFARAFDAYLGSLVDQQA